MRSLDIDVQGLPDPCTGDPGVHGLLVGSGSREQMGPESTLGRDCSQPLSHHGPQKAVYRARNARAHSGVQRSPGPCVLEEQEGATHLTV